MTLKNIQWVGTEKVDGTNIRVYWDGYRISIAGRTDKAEIPPHLYKYLSDLFLTPEMESLVLVPLAAKLYNKNGGIIKCKCKWREVKKWNN